VVEASTVRRVAPVGSVAEAEARLYQAMYGCTMHSGGLLLAIAACLNAEADGRFTLTDVATRVAARATHAGATAPDPERWRFRAMIWLCERLCVTSQ
jgi:hypothetical protein